MSGEHDIQKQILDYLHFVGITAWRNNSGQAGGVSFGKKGLPDIIGYYYDGRFLGIEVKQAKGVVTKAQAEIIEEAQESGALVFVARSVEDVLHVLQAEKPRGT